MITLGIHIFLNNHPTPFFIRYFNSSVCYVCLSTCSGQTCQLKFSPPPTLKKIPRFVTHCYKSIWVKPT